MPYFFPRKFFCEKRLLLTREQIHEIIIGTIKTIQLRVALTNLGPENAYDVELNVSFPSNLYINTLNQVEASATKYGMVRYYVLIFNITSYWVVLD